MKKLTIFLFLVLIFTSKNSHAFWNLTAKDKEAKRIQVKYSDTKILYVASKENTKKIAIIDFNGKNLRYLTDGENLVQTPVFSRTNKDEIFYLEYIDKSPQIKKLNVVSGEKWTIEEFEDMTFMPNFYINDENVLLLSALKYNASNIYQIDLNKFELVKLTYNKSADITPSFSPDNEKIVFCSNRSGSKKLYVMNADGSNIEKLTHNRGSYSKPVWSPDGKLIAFVKLFKGKFHIGVMNHNGESERSLTSAYSISNVKWSSDGRYLIYSKQKLAFGKPYIYITDVLNQYEYRVPTPLGEEALNPDWVEY